MGISEQAASELGTSVVRLVKLFSAMRQVAPKVHPGVDTSSYPILFVLARGPMRVSALAESIHSDVSTVSRQVSALAAHGLVEKIADTEDRRAFIVTITPAGADVIERLQHQRCRWFQAMLEDWEPVEVEALRTSLDRFSAEVEGSKEGLLAMHRQSQHRAAQRRAAQHRAAQRRAAQHRAAQRRAAQHRAATSATGEVSGRLAYADCKDVRAALP